MSDTLMPVNESCRLAVASSGVKAIITVTTSIAIKRRHTRLVITSGFLYFFFARADALMANTTIAMGRVITFGNNEIRSSSTARSVRRDIEP